MKTKEELNALNEGGEAVNKKLQGLTEEDMKKVSIVYVPVWDFL